MREHIEVHSYPVPVPGGAAELHAVVFHDADADVCSIVLPDLTEDERDLTLPQALAWATALLEAADAARLAWGRVTEVTERRLSRDERLALAEARRGELEEATTDG